MMSDLIFSFQENPSFRVQVMIACNFLGIEKVDLIYNDPETDSISFRRVAKTDTQVYFDTSLKTARINFDKLHHLESINPRWIKEEDMPYHLAFNQFSDLTLDDEFNVKILFFYLVNYLTEKRDYFFIYLRNRAYSFGIKKENSNISESEMGVFAMVLLTVIAEIQQKAKSDQEKYAGVLKNLENRKNKIAELKNELDIKTRRIYDIYNDALKSHIEPIAENAGKKIIIRESVYDKLEKEGLSFSQITNTILDAIWREIYSSTSDEIIIEETDLIIQPIFEQSPGKDLNIPEKPKSEFGLTREHKIRIFLDELLEVVENQMKNRESLSSEEVGKLLKKTLKPPAIREKLYKYRVLVKEIFKAEPGKYQVLRDHFAPITNIIDDHYYPKRKVQNK